MRATERLNFTEAYLIDPVLATLADTDGWILDIGCGLGYMTGALAERFDGRVVGIDRSGPRLDQAQASNPDVEFHHADVGESLPDELRDRFTAAVSTEVIEHLPFPRVLFRAARESGATQLVLTTPYHGYLKNIALAVTGSFDRHWQTGRDFGHVNFFSVATISALSEEQGWRVERIGKLGRIPPLAKSMLIDLSVATAPEDDAVLRHP